MRIGDRVTVVPETLYFNLHEEAKKKVPMTGTVIYIHPQGRFYVVEFSFKFGYTVREAFDSRPKYQDKPGRTAYGKKVMLE